MDVGPGYRLAWPDVDARGYRTGRHVEVVPDVLILPGFAFDEYGTRLGHGGGWFDQYLAAHHSVCAIGVCFEWQLVDRLPKAAHDVQVQYIVTPAGVRRTARE